MRITFLILVLAAVAVLVWMSAFTVDPTEYVYLTQFGRHIATFDGSRTDADAGLHWHWPWPIEAIRRLDRRLQFIDLPAIELLTRDSAGADQAGSSVDKTLTVEAYVCWRIDESNVDLFVRRIDTPAQARDILGQRVNSELGALLGKLRMDDLINTNVVQPAINGPGGSPTVTKVDETMSRLRDTLLNKLGKSVLEGYGIDIQDVRLKRFNHPIKVRETIFSRIISERELKAAKYRNEGKLIADEIRTKADAKVDQLSRAAEKAEKETKRKAEAEAELIMADAFNKDKNFFRFWNEMEQMKAILGNPKTTLLLSTHRSVFDFLFNAPGLDGQPAVPRPNPGSAMKGGDPPPPAKEK